MLIQGESGAADPGFAEWLLENGPPWREAEAKSLPELSRTSKDSARVMHTL